MNEASFSKKLRVFEFNVMVTITMISKNILKPQSEIELSVGHKSELISALNLLCFGLYPFFF